jgi:hypothetical protein
MRTTFLFLTVLLLATSSLAQHRPVKKSQALAPPLQEKHSTIQFRNSDLVVRRLDIPAGESSSIGGSVHDYVLVSYGQSSVQISGYQTKFEMNLSDGEMQVLQGGWPHTILNQSQRPAELVCVEVTQNISPKSALCGLGAKNCYQTRFGKAAQGEYQQSLLFETDSTALYRVQVDPGVSVHQHADNRKHLVIALSPVEAHAGTNSFNLKPGETFWYPGGFEELGNDGSQAATLLLLELK